MKTISLAALLLLGAVGAHAACPAVVPPNVACVSWLPSTGWTDGTPYAPGTVVTYVVQLIENGAAIRTVATTTQLSASISGLPKGTRCFAVVAMVGASNSVLSNAACKVVRFPGPSDGKIEGPTDGSIEPRN